MLTIFLELGHNLWSSTYQFSLRATPWMTSGAVGRELFLKGELGALLGSPLAHYTAAYCADCCRSSPNEFCISKLIFCQNHLRLMTCVCVAIKHTARMCPLLSPCSIKQPSQICRSAPCSALSVGSRGAQCKWDGGWPLVEELVRLSGCMEGNAALSSGDQIY